MTKMDPNFINTTSLYIDYEDNAYSDVSQVMYTGMDK
jgi:hypothetical protein